MIFKNLSILALLVLSLPGCPSPPPTVDDAEASPPTTPDASAGTSPDATVPPSADGSLDAVAPPSAEGSPDIGAPHQPADGSAPPPAPAGQGISVFGRYVSADTPTVTLHVVVEGMSKGEINFSAVKGTGTEGLAEAIHVQRFTSSTFDIEAPANFEGKLIASAVSIGDDGLPEEKGSVAVVKDPLVIGSVDQTITLSKPVIP